MFMELFILIIVIVISFVIEYKVFKNKFGDARKTAITQMNISDEEKENHPARFCLVEIENIHDKVLEFEP